MARSHHRKKHREQLRQFKQSHETTADTSKGKARATWVFGIAGAILGFAVSYFASGGKIIWMSAGLLAGSTAGYFIGRRIDEQKSN